MSGVVLQLKIFHDVKGGLEMALTWVSKVGCRMMAWKPWSWYQHAQVPPFNAWHLWDVERVTHIQGLELEDQKCQCLKGFCWNCVFPTQYLVSLLSGSGIELYTKSVFLFSIGQYFLRVHHTDTKGKLGWEFHTKPKNCFEIDITFIYHLWVSRDILGISPSFIVSVFIALCGFIGKLSLVTMGFGFSFLLTKY